MTPLLSHLPQFRSAASRIWHRHRKPWPVTVLSPADLQWATDQLVTMRDEPVTLTSLHGFLAQNPEPTVPPNWSDLNREVFTATCQTCGDAFESFDSAEKLCQRCYLDDL